MRGYAAAIYCPFPADQRFLSKCVFVRMAGGLWIVTGVIAIFDFKLSSFISYSNVIAIGLGQILGGAIQEYNISSITPDMNAEQRARLYLHPGFLIWICALILFVAVFLAVKRYRKKPQHRQLRTIRSLS